MNKLWLIIKREYLVRVRKKTFILATLLTPLAVILFYALIFFIPQWTNETKRIVVKDDSGIFSRPIADSKQAKFKFSDKSLDELRKTYKDDKFDGVLHIPDFKNLNNELYIQYYSDQQIAITQKGFIEGRISRRIKDHKMTEVGLDQKQLDQLKTNVNLKQTKQTLGEDGEIEEDNQEANAGIATAISFMLTLFFYMALILYGQMVMRSVMEEKINRIVEIIISSVKPFQLMLGKIIGVAGVGLTQILIWGGAISLIQMVLVPFLVGRSGTANLPETEGMENEEVLAQAMNIMEAVGDMNWFMILPLVIVFFLGGYFIYASLYAAVGSAVGEDQGEAQSLIIPITIPIMIGFLISMSMVNNPNGGLAVFGSLFPLFSPIVMPARLAFDPPVWQIVLSVVILLASALFFVWLSARIYRVGIFMYGKKPSFKNIMKWMFYKA